MKKFKRYISSYILCFVSTFIYGYLLLKVVNDSELVGFFVILSHALGYTLWLENKGDK